MHWVEIVGGVFGGGVLTTVASRLLPNSDKKIDFIKETQKDLLNRQNELENRIEKRNNEYIALMEKFQQRELELLKKSIIQENKINELTQKIKILEEKLNNE